MARALACKVTQDRKSGAMILELKARAGKVPAVKTERT